MAHHEANAFDKQVMVGSGRKEQELLDTSNLVHERWKSVSVRGEISGNVHGEERVKPRLSK